MRSNRVVGRCCAAACANWLANAPEVARVSDAEELGTEVAALCFAIEDAVAFSRYVDVGRLDVPSVDPSAVVSPRVHESAARTATESTIAPSTAKGSHLGKFGRIFRSAAISDCRGGIETARFVREGNTMAVTTGIDAGE